MKKNVFSDRHPPNQTCTENIHRAFTAQICI